MKIRSDVISNLIQLFIVIITTVGATILSIFSLTHGIFEVFPFLYIFAIIFVVYFYSKYGAMYSLGISIVYVALVYYFGSPNSIQIAISTAWFAIFIVIGIIASSYANQLHNEEKKIRNLFENTQDGIFCFNIDTLLLHDANPSCARMLNYNREDLIGKELPKIWVSEIERDQFISCIKEGKRPCKNEVLLISKDGTPHTCFVSAILTMNNIVFCSTIDINKQKISEDEIRHTLDDIERQLRERTVYLENVNEKLKAEIFEHRKFEDQFIPRKNNFSRSEENWR